MTISREDQARSFDTFAADYDRYRPGYPAELFDVIAERLHLPARPAVVDLGAGTGRASLAMAERGWTVIAVDPAPGMLAQLDKGAQRARLAVTTVVAGAEETGLPGGVFDLVTAAQSFHWFDHARAVPEMARLLHGNGGVAVFWNAPDEERSDLVAAHSELLRMYVPEELLERRGPARESRTPLDLAAGGLFEALPQVQLTHEVQMTPDQYVGLAFTASYVRVATPEAATGAFEADLRALIAQHEVDGHVVVPYRVDSWLAKRMH